MALKSNWAPSKLAPSLAWLESVEITAQDFLDHAYRDAVLQKIAKKFDLIDQKPELARSLREAGHEYITRGPVGAPINQKNTQKEVWNDFAQALASVDGTLWTLRDELSFGLLSRLNQVGAIPKSFQLEPNGDWHDVKSDWGAFLFVQKLVTALSAHTANEIATNPRNKRRGPRRQVGLEKFVYELGDFWLSIGRKITIDNHFGAVSWAF